jgi:hypothetical protein
MLATIDPEAGVRFGRGFFEPFQLVAHDVAQLRQLPPIGVANPRLRAFVAGSRASGRLL